MNGNKILTTLTIAGIAGLVVLNFKGSNTLLATLGSIGSGYVKTVQGR